MQEEVGMGFCKHCHTHTSLYEAQAHPWGEMHHTPVAKPPRLQLLTILWTTTDQGSRTLQGAVHPVS